MLFAFLFFCSGFCFCLALAVPLLLFAGARAFCSALCPLARSSASQCPALAVSCCSSQCLMCGPNACGCSSGCPLRAGLSVSRLCSLDWRPLHALRLLVRRLVACTTPATFNSDGRHESSGPLRGAVRAAVWCRRLVPAPQSRVWLGQHARRLLPRRNLFSILKLIVEEPRQIVYRKKNPPKRVLNLYILRRILTGSVSWQAFTSLMIFMFVCTARASLRLF